MADVLDQSEVDALLAAVEAGGVETAVERMSSRGRAASREAQAYDFKRPERVSKEQMRALEAIHDGFARSFGASLSGFLRTIVEIRVATTEQLTYSEFIHSLPNPTNFNLLTAEPLEGQLCLEISPLIIYPIIDRLLGGSNAELFIPQRPLTMIEQRLVSRITSRAINALIEAWSDLMEVEFAITEVESNPHLVQIVAPNEVVVVIGFEIKMGGRVGTMSLCIPFNVIEPVMDKLLSQGWLAYQRKSTVEDKSEEIAKGLGVTEVNLAAFLAETQMTVRELLSLQPGDIIQTEKPMTGEMIIQVEGRNKFAGKIGRVKENLAIRVTRLAEVEEPL
jgi:flagellar motor switch protein FliM